MITLHEFNSNWYGNPVGIVKSPAFFSLPYSDRRAMLSQYLWVEYSAATVDDATYQELGRTGFRFLDVQVPFRVALDKCPAPRTDKPIYTISAETHSFSVSVDEIRSFSQERFLRVPGMTQSLLDRRYALWAENIIREHPRHCLRVVMNGATQGWWLAEPAEGFLNLTLGMLSQNSCCTGYDVFQAAFAAYADQGYSEGRTRFSVSNTPAFNIYASLGARYAPPIYYYLWAKQWLDETTN